MGGGGVGAKVKKEKMPQEIINNFGQKNNAQGGSLQVRLLQINYEVNAKSRLEIIIISRSTYYY